MWFGTQDGINRYDGHSFKVYKSDVNDPFSLHGVNIAGLVEDPQGNIWVGTEEGLNCYERSTEHFKLITNPAVPQSKKRTSPFYVDKNELWYIREGEGIVAYSFKTKSHRTIAPKVYITQDFDYIDWTTKTPQGDVWMLKPEGLARYSTTEKKYYHYFSNSTENVVGPALGIYCLYVDKKNIVWLGSAQGLIRLDPVSREYQIFDRTSDGRMLGSVFSVAASSDQNLWIGTQRNGMWTFDTKHEILFSANLPFVTPHPLDNYEIVRVYIDDRGIIWANIDPDGLLKIIPNAPVFQKMVDAPLLPENKRFNNYSVRCMAEAPNGDVWIGTEGELAILDKKTHLIKARYLTETPKGSMHTHNYLKYIFKDKRNQMWVGTYGGIYKFDSLQKQFKLLMFKPNATRSDYVRNITELPDGLFLIGTPDGSWLFDPSTTTFKKAPILENKNLFATFFSSDSTLWLAAYFDGLYGFKYKNRKWQQVFHGLTAFNINLMRQGISANKLWIATEKGLLDFNVSLRKYKFYNTQQGLANSYIYAILIDKSQNLWLSTNRGISKFDVAAQTFRNFDLPDGIQSYEYNGNACLLGSDGRMWLGGVKGLNSFFSEKINQLSYKPRAHFYNLKVNDRLYETEKQVNEVSNITLNYGQNTWSLEFAAIDFYSNGRNFYQYQLEGQDKNWVYGGSRNYVRYANLPAGNYTFKLRAANRDGIWSSEEKKIGIIIMPPFWQSWWFYLLCSVALGYLVLSIFQNRISFLRKKEQDRLKIALEAQEQERRYIAQDLHDEIGARLATLKLYATSMAQHFSVHSEGEEMKNKTIEIINESIVDVRRMLRELSPRIVEQYGYATGLEELVSKIRQSGQIEIEIDTSRLPERLLTSIEIGLYRITQELMNNTLKHAGAKKITVRAHQENKLIHLDYFDDGQGFEYKIAKQGLGIGNIESRVALMNGTISWRPKIGEGNAVFIEIPAN